MERFPLKSSGPKPASTYQSVYKKGGSTTNGRNGIHSSGEDDMIDITPGLQQAGDSSTATPTNHGTFQLYDHGRNSTASANYGREESDDDVY